ncbi:MAG: GNAT family N-acetyltransferase [Chloroflexales bacterium]
MSVVWAFVDPAAPAWLARVTALWSRLDPALSVPDYFVKTTFVKLGGRLAVAESGAVALLFPRGLDGGRRMFTLRMHGAGDMDALAALLAPDQFIAYDPTRPEALSYAATHTEVGGFAVGAPARDELAAIRTLHRAIWGGDEAARYPDDLHSHEFGPATSLVARRDGRVVGFLLGFYRFGLPGLASLGLPHQLDLAVESQVMGIVPEARRYGLAAILKREQARLALARGLDLIHWTTDPLQFPNAVLNFGKLRAVAGEHFPSFYPFQNALNRVPASRLGLTWLPRSAHGHMGLADAPVAGERDLARFPGCMLLNDGPTPRGDPGEAPALALNIPNDWTALQHDDVALASRWRTTSDELLARYLGVAPGRYLVVDAAAESDRRYLVLQRFTPELLR